jgi:hypothetical protein
LNDWFIVKYTKPVINQPYFQNITAIPQTFSTIQISNLTRFTVELNYSTPAGRRDIFATGTYGNSAAILANIFDLASTTARPPIDVVNISFSFSFQPQPQIIIEEPAVSNGEVVNSPGLSASNSNLFNLLISISWDDPNYNGRIVGQVTKFIAAMKQVAQIVGLGDPYIYLNDAAVWQDRIDGYGVTVGKELQKTSEKYGSTGVFQK